MEIKWCDESVTNHLSAFSPSQPLSLPRAKAWKLRASLWVCEWKITSRSSFQDWGCSLLVEHLPNMQATCHFLLYGPLYNMAVYSFKDNRWTFAATLNLLDLLSLTSRFFLMRTRPSYAHQSYGVGGGGTWCLPSWIESSHWRRAVVISWI
jgi:hypothetical protein